MYELRSSQINLERGVVSKSLCILSLCAFLAARVSVPAAFLAT
jgi:hypothetical protein